MPPVSFESRHRLPEDLNRCAQILKAGSRSFHAASRLLPPRVREPVSALYAFCRVADDEVDLAPDPARRLRHLRERLDRAYAGQPFQTPVDRTFADVVAAYAIPRAVPDALLEGLAWDVDGRVYDTLGDLEAYAARVAGTVGVMMTLIMGVRTTQALARACDLGVAMQLTNIARDVGEDARNGRVYLPHDWLREAGQCPEQFAAAPMFDRPVQAIVARLLARAETLYQRGGRGIMDLPADCRLAIRAASSIYAEIGRRMRAKGVDPVMQRVVVPTSRKLQLVAGLWLPLSVLPRQGPLDAPALPATQFLVDAVSAHPGPGFGPVRPASIPAKVEWIIMLFEQMERRERAARTRAMLDGAQT